ncbi:hypothetical protein HanIR_Chr17g0849591 [Helianthus annuus]|nr:hypothetical protein HanIR_Chr17g0849591 [Helianthus annuus]
MLNGLLLSSLYVPSCLPSRISSYLTWYDLCLYCMFNIMQVCIDVVSLLVIILTVNHLVYILPCL